MFESAGSYHLIHFQNQGIRIRHLCTNPDEQDNTVYHNVILLKNISYTHLSGAFLGKYMINEYITKYYYCQFIRLSLCRERYLTGEVAW